MKSQAFKKIAIASLLLSSFSVFAEDVKTPEQMPNILSGIPVEDVKLMTPQEMDATRGEGTTWIYKYRRNGTLRKVIIRQD